MNDPIFRINSGLFYAAHLFCCKEPTRYYLRGVFIEPHPKKGVTLTATDGHRLIVIHDKDGSATRPIILKARKSERQRIKPNGHNAGHKMTAWQPADYGVGQSNVFIVATFNEHLKPQKKFMAKEIFGDFPNYRKIVPEQYNTFGMAENRGFDTEKLRDFTRAGQMIARAIGLRGTRTISGAVRLTPGHMAGSNGGLANPLLVNFGKELPAFGVLADCVGVDGCGLPEWFVKAPAQTGEAAEVRA